MPSTDRTPTGVATYATQMISINDNTAADALAHIVGARVLVPLAMGSAPFPRTREMFVVKLPPRAALCDRFRAATNVVVRRSTLAKLDALDFLSASELET